MSVPLPFQSGFSAAQECGEQLRAQDMARVAGKLDIPGRPGRPEEPDASAPALPGMLGLAALNPKRGKAGPDRHRPGETTDNQPDLTRIAQRGRRCSGALQRGYKLCGSGIDPKKEPASQMGGHRLSGQQPGQAGC